jgi:hypothetical protein
LSGTIILAGIGTGTFIEPLYVFSNQTVQAVGFGNRVQFDLIDVFEMGVGIDTYDLTTSFGPIFEPNPLFYQFVGARLDIGNLTFGNMSDVTFTATTEPPVLTASLDLDPNVINLASHAPWVTAYIEPSGFSPTNIDISTLRLAGSAAADPKFAIVGDHDANGIPDLMVKFRRPALDPLLTPGVNSLELTGLLGTGESFVGTDEARVFDNGGGHKAASVAPNPLNPSGMLSFNTVKPGRVRVTMFDLQGRLVRTLTEMPVLPAGEHAVRIDGRGERGEVLPSGVYFYRVDSPDGAVTGHFAILK